MAPFNYKTEIDRYKRYYQNVEPALAKPANKAYTAIIFSFLAVSLFGWYAIRPTMQTIFSLKRETTDKIDINKKMEDKISALIEAQAVYQEVESKIPIINQAIPTNSDAVSLMNQLRSLASESSVSVIAAMLPPLPLTHEQSPTNTSAPLKLADFTVTMSISGTYANIKNFLTGILNMRRIIEISSMTFSPQRRGFDTIQNESTESAEPAVTSGEIQVDLKLKAYYFN